MFHIDQELSLLNFYEIAESGKFLATKKNFLIFNPRQIYSRNGLQIYIDWSRHEPRPGSFDFSGENDIEKFVQMAQDNDLFVILRPGPFIDAGK
jgi:hypothetical protein